MATKVIDAKGLTCPRPVLMVTTTIKKGDVKPGDILEVVADCAAFETDIRSWCATFKKVLIFIRDEGKGVKRAQIQI